MTDLVVSPANVDSGLVASIQRLVVLTPQVDGLEAELARRVWLLAAPRGLDVLYLSLVDDTRNEPLSRRRMATLAALTRDPQMQVETALSFESDWPAAVRSVWRPGDLLICPVEVMRAVSTLHIPLYMLDTLGGSMPRRLQATLARWAFALLPYVIVIAFFVLQAQVASWPHNAAYYVMMIGSVVLEAGLILSCVRDNV